MEGPVEKEKKKRQGRVPTWTMWETKCCVVCVVVIIRDKYSQGLGNVEMM
jgi:hypothetical protein